ncbi:hypothetical protein ART_2549 [Arthrobacter sp. PAMC 25486]|nr:hypothetical protein [Arthrobacter sp. PAMC 25486]AIY02148.1 hypothetical protein ART_2549 [Arthrobacter sp. PAMC 25486]
MNPQGRKATVLGIIGSSLAAALIAALPLNSIVEFAMTLSRIG